MLQNSVVLPQVPVPSFLLVAAGAQRICSAGLKKKIKNILEKILGMMK